MKTEQRTIVGAELRAAGKFQIAGIAAPYNRNSKNLGGFVERIAPGAFTRSLNAGADVKALFNHDASQILGRTKSGTLKLSDSPEGLRFICQLDKSNSFHGDVYASIARGDIDACSFAFSVPAGGDSLSAGGVDDTGVRCDLRTLTDVDLFDVSAVTNPAYSDTSVDVRSGLYVIHQRTFTPAQRTVRDASIEALIAAAGSDIARRSVASRQAKELLAAADAERRERAKKLGLEIFQQQQEAENDEALRERMRLARGF